MHVVNPSLPTSVLCLCVGLGAAEARREPYKWYGERALEGATTPNTKSRRQADGFAGRLDMAAKERG